MKKFFLAPLAALFFAFSANASPLKSLTLQQPQQTADRGLQNGLIEVNTHRNTLSVIATDALYGGLAGLAIGAGAGLIVGGIFGAVDAASAADRAFAPGTGFNSAFKPNGGKF